MFLKLRRNTLKILQQKNEMSISQNHIRIPLQNISILYGYQYLYNRLNVWRTTFCLKIFSYLLIWTHNKATQWQSMFLLGSRKAYTQEINLPINLPKVTANPFKCTIPVPFTLYFCAYWQTSHSPDLLSIHILAASNSQLF